ncbi:XdhC family protein [Nocardia camponoti]|uniref:XshC-Cox1 family protein n=1 Tax=Nocardia camponoti TaxID=1616106 RepID=A0A917QF31_9NOCA|nr:XdhC family protein [Nocardia camponoti]GGK47534.1 hypothetical protein GCM10011591_18590 [Nocardia camponoti]
MRAILDELIAALADGPVALARVVDRTGAGPRETGSAMALTASGRVLGSLSGGCVEAAVLATAGQVLADGVASAERFAAGDEFAVGLPCGGEIEVFTERLAAVDLPLLMSLRASLAARAPIAFATTLTDDPQRKLFDPNVNEPWHGLDADVRAQLATGRNGLVGAQDCTPALADRPRTFVQVFAAPARMILAGSNDFARALAAAATAIGYHVTVVDARETFTSTARFPSAAEVVVDWPHRYFEAEQAAGRIDARTVVCVLTHDTKFDVPLLKAALAAPALAFLGALGSRRATEDRTTRLIETGCTATDLAKIHSPLGLDIGAHTPEETAISILAQILATRSTRPGTPLSTGTGPIHG